MKLYRIKDWGKHFEIRDSKRVSGPLSWVAVPTKTDGFGFSRIALEKDPCELLSAWYLMLGIAAKQDQAHRGELQRDGIPLTAEDLAIITRFPIKAFVRALEFFASPKQAWLECVALDGPSMDHAWPINGPSMDHVCGSSVPTVQDSTLQDRTGQDRTVGRDAGASPASDSEWLEETKRNPSYQGIQVDAEWGKMRAWCEVNRKKPSRRRFINWLNRCERPMNLNSSRPRLPSLGEPSGWREFCADEFNGPVFLDPSSDQFAKTWGDLPRETQQLIRQRMNQ